MLVVICLTSYILSIGQSILIPLVFSMFFAFMLKPICAKIENKITYRPFAILMSFVLALTPIIILITFFSLQLLEVVQNMDSISSKIETAFNDFLGTIKSFVGISKKESKAILDKNSSELVKAPLAYLGTTLSLSSNFLINLFLTFIYTFLLLLYRTAIKKFYIMQFNKDIKDEAEDLLSRIQTVIQKYLYGLLIVIAILGVLNSFGLFIIGIKYAFFWGFLAAFLAIIPYIGTILGGLLPFLYTFASTDTYWQPIAVIILFGLVQVIEGNLITPKVVGSSIKINPLAAIVALLVGSSMWGMAGLILALPSIAIIRIIFGQIDFLKPISLLLSDEIFDKDVAFEERYDKSKFRLSDFFKK